MDRRVRRPARHVAHRQTGQAPDHDRHQRDHLDLAMSEGIMRPIRGQQGRRAGNVIAATAVWRRKNGRLRKRLALVNAPYRDAGSRPACHRRLDGDVAMAADAKDVARTQSGDAGQHAEKQENGQTSLSHAAIRRRGDDIRRHAPRASPRSSTLASRSLTQGQLTSSAIRGRVATVSALNGSRLELLPCPTLRVFSAKPN